ncbi:hypothetical protein [Frankia sp. Cr1]|nr:hypothetical protein [Frankia sp. Cr1]
MGKHSRPVDCPGCAGAGTVEVTNDGKKEQKTCQLCRGTGRA